MISIVIPTYNEASCIEQCLKSLLVHIKDTDHEIIVADGTSTDETPSIAAKLARVVISAKGKGIQMNSAAAYARGDILFFVHADMHLPVGTLERIQAKIYDHSYDGGGFSNVFTGNNKKIKLLGRILNMRIFDNDHKSNLLFYGDNGIFCKKSTFQELGGFEEIPIMEDYDFSKRMAATYKVVRIKEPPIIVSDRRHVEAGFLKTRLQWILIRKLYEVGVSPFTLAKWYKDIRANKIKQFKDS